MDAYLAGGVGKRSFWSAFQRICLGTDVINRSAITMRFVRDVFVDSYNPTIEGASIVYHGPRTSRLPDM
jgi:hypothetical protein